ncbi:MAG TPA: DUF2752 domain-containing protein [Clostridia bacterium]|jgi:hypothetical protein|nr:DUF2752 domain-containing protein [Clostridia bacterium]HOF27641.1 DUF2752 domain-containing protein [Clostridia bacterium]HOR90361.1 DUF2752 domain-containing protein [Clostridia bacterium]HPL09060.1 DUF2752 domain-containing protein [Clostridia bacterium]HPY97923.1 DUF2752 domain-containing protein [Clostridia bacterium]
MRNWDTDTLRKVRERLLNDIKKAWIPAVACIAYVVVMILAVGEVCPSKLLFGVPCAGCGMVRAFALLITFRFKEAFIMHPGIYLMLIAFIIFIIMRYFLNSDAKRIKILVTVTLSLLFVIFVVRVATSFGTEPLTVYNNAVLLRFIRLFY